MKIGMSEIMFDDQSYKESIPAAGKIGYDGIELRPKPNHLPKDVSPGDLGEIKRMISDAGLEVHCIACFTGNYARKSDAECREQLEELARFIELAKELDCRALRHWAAPISSADATDDDLARAAEWVGKACDTAAKDGIALCLELHHKTIIDSVPAAMEFVDRVGRDNLLVIHDAANLYQEGVEYGRNSIKHLGDRLFELHVKDIVEVTDDSNPEAGQPYKGRRFVNRVVDEGGVDQYSIFRGLKEARFDGYVTVEAGWLSRLDPYEVAERSYQRVRALLDHFGL